MRVKKKLLLCLVCGQVLFYNSAVLPKAVEAAYPQPDTVQDVYCDGKAIFRLNFFDYHAEADPVTFPGSDAYKSTYKLSNELKNSAIQGASYVAQLVGPQAVNSQPVNVYIFTWEEANANANAFAGAIQNEEAVDIMQSALTDGKLLPHWGGTYIRIGKMDTAESEDYGWSLNFGFQLPNNGNKFALAPTLAHEILHGFGIDANTYNNSEDGSWQFYSQLNAYDTHLYDVSGKQGSVEMVIVNPGDPDQEAYNPEDVFLVASGGESGVYFSGDNVRQVLNGAQLGDAVQVSGVPINGWEPYYDGKFILDMSHLQLRNGLMSHYDYRNYNTFMEAELAVLQDIGYKIDRRNWFGRSVYNDGLTAVNYDGYSARNADGTAYLAGVPNLTDFGVGLHIYGSNNDITQVGDILTDGLGSIGIRMDGLDSNRLTVAEGTQVLVNGSDGTGILAAYGRNHNVAVNGTVTALGQGGIGARFDFGDNIIGNTEEYRGSYINYGYGSDHDKYGNKQYVNFGIGIEYNGHTELQGALVDNFDIGGTLAGRAAAIYIAPNAFVKNINIRPGAQLYGDIISSWMDFSGKLDMQQYGANYERIGIQYDGVGKKADLVTQLNFDADIDYSGNITGKDNLQLNVNGGKLVYTGQAAVLNVNVAEDAQLLGGSYKLQDKSNDPLYDSMATGIFNNQGLIGALTPANSDSALYIDGALMAQGSKLQFTADKDYIGYIDVTGNADITDTTLHIDANGVYVPDKTYTAAIVKAGGTLEGRVINLEEYKSGMLGAVAERAAFRSAADNPVLGITFRPQDNLGVRTAVQQQMYNNISSILQARPAYNYDYAELYSLGAAEAKAALTSLTGGVQSELATAVKQDRSAAEAVYGRLDATGQNNELWAVLQKGWGSMDGRSSAASKIHSFGVTLGQDKSWSESWRAGALLHYGRLGVSSGRDKGSADDMRLGLYGRYGKRDAANIDMYLTYGWQKNESKRSLVNLPERLYGDYNSEALSAGLQLSRAYPLTGYSSWSIKPYIGADAAIYKLHGFSETGARGYSQHYGGQIDKMLSAGIGIEVKRMLDTAGSYSIGVGYRRIFDGEDTPLTASLSAGGTAFTSVGNGSAGDILTLKLQGEVQLQKNLTVSGQLLHDWGQDTRRLTAGVNAAWSF